ncbi:hypothetical protein ACFPRL_11915 [Pseudoclavibacter helvolus]
MHDQEEEDGDAGDAVENPGPHALVPPVQRAATMRLLRCVLRGCRARRSWCLYG